MEKYKLDFIYSIINYNLLVKFIPSLEVREFIACQFALECDFGYSELAYNAYNLCGMKEPHRRFHYSCDSYKTFAKYVSWDDCIKDYLMWIFYNRPYQNSLTNLDSFIFFLRDSGYCPEKDYISKIQSIYSQFKNS